MAKTPETSDYTSIQERPGVAPEYIPIESSDTNESEIPQQEPLKLAELIPCAGNEHIPFDLIE